MKKILLFLSILFSFTFVDNVKAYSGEEIGRVMAEYAKYVYNERRNEFGYIYDGSYINKTYAGKKTYNGKYGTDCNGFVGFIVCNSTNTPCKQVALPNVFQYDGNWIVNSSNGWNEYFNTPYKNLNYNSIVNKINNNELKPGDLVTRCKDGCKKNTHIQMYVGNGMFVENNYGDPSLRYFHISEMYNKDSTYTVIRITDSGAAKINLDHIYYPNGDGTKTDVKDKLGLSFLNNNQANDNRKTIYIGDSRTYGMNLYGITNSSNTVYGVGYGYNWFTGNGSFSSSNTNSTSGGIAGANSKMNSGEKYNIVIWLGVNDYTYVSADKYYSTYFSLAKNEWKDHNIYIVSVGPVDDDKAIYVDNKGINKFNDAMEELIKNGNLSNLNYIDLGYTESSINSYDSEGLHYGKSDYQKIFNNINNGIVKIENNSNNNPIGGNDSPEGEGNDLPEGGGNPQPGGNNNESLTCNDFFDADMMDIISTIYKIIEFLAIILTIVLGMIDFAKGITSDDQDLIKKASKHFVKRLIICVVIFVLPLLIDPLEQLIGITGCDNADMINNGGANQPLVPENNGNNNQVNNNPVDDEEGDNIVNNDNNDKPDNNENDNIEYTNTNSHTNSITGIKYKIYEQRDPEWNLLPFPGQGQPNATIGDRGCNMLSEAVISSSVDSSITPKTIYQAGHRSNDPTLVIEDVTKGQFDCTTAKNTHKMIKNDLQKGNVVIILVGNGSGNCGNTEGTGYSKFTDSTHYMALIDISSDGQKIFVGNSYGNGKSSYGKATWHNASDVLTCVMSTYTCKPSQELIDKFN